MDSLAGPGGIVGVVDTGKPDGLVCRLSHRDRNSGRRRVDRSSLFSEARSSGDFHRIGVRLAHRSSIGIVGSELVLIGILRGTP